ncbi:MAG: hypothetical protein M1371_03475 [Actinobacteria bacterium]|nr:hypothetical protein [Actinomycetota bacterium]
MKGVCRTSENGSKDVHKDFHGAMSFSMSYVRNKFGEEKLRDFFKKSALEVHQPLIDKIKKDGLGVLKNYLESAYTMEDGEFEIKLDTDELLLRVKKCPAILHMKKFGYQIDDEFCEMSTKVVNEAIASAAGLRSSVKYDQENGCCEQRFYREEK